MLWCSFIAVTNKGFVDLQLKLIVSQANSGAPNWGMYKLLISSIYSPFLQSDFFVLKSTVGLQRLPIPFDNNERLLVLCSTPNPKQPFCPFELYSGVFLINSHERASKGTVRLQKNHVNQMSLIMFHFYFIINLDMYIKKKNSRLSFHVFQNTLTFFAPSFFQPGFFSVHPDALGLQNA